MKGGNQRVFAIVLDLNAGWQMRPDSVGRTEVRDFAVGHHNDGVGLMHHRVLKTTFEGIAGVCQNRTADSHHLPDAVRSGMDVSSLPLFVGC
jgi:hypothetical protein